MTSITLRHADTRDVFAYRRWNSKPEYVWTLGNWIMRYSISLGAQPGNVQIKIGAGMNWMWLEAALNEKLIEVEQCPGCGGFHDDRHPEDPTPEPRA